jgi:outer membrane receptor protein involved in Fe transport
MNTRTILTSTLLFCSIATASELQPVTVTADFRPTTLDESTASVSVISSESIQKRGATHIEEVLNQASNVNISSGASRAHYFQIRGIGERSQFKAPINPSVGLYIDGMDFSRSGASATMFDISQVEVIKGPQGTRYGANALAGIINLTSNEPTKESKAHIEGTVGEYGTKSFGVAAGGTLVKDRLLGRASIFKNSSDGYMENSFLNKDDTNGIDELTARGHLKWLVNDNLTLNLKYLHLDIDNGYDAFTLDNTRVSKADEPGRDTQKTDAFSLSAEFDINSKMRVEAVASYSDSELEYSYDEDWSYEGEFSDDLYPYKSFDQYLRDRKNSTVELRVLSNEDGRIFNDSTSWVAGIYYNDKSEDLTRKYTYLDNDFTSSYDTTSSAIYTQLDTMINEKLVLISGLRVELWDAKYRDSDKVSIDTDETLYGGKIGLEYALNENHLTHLTLSRGYKAGGVNTDGTLPKNLLDFDTEYLWNLEAGINSSLLNDTLQTRVTAFYAQRRDQQVNSSIVTTRDDGSTDFTGYMDNAAKGKNYGLEIEGSYSVTDKLHLSTSIGLLKAEYDEYKDPESLDGGLDLEGREQAHAPSYTYSVSGDYKILPNLTAGVSVEGKDSFYLSDRHNAKTKSYTLLNADIEYKKGNYSVRLWGRNLGDKDYIVRGFGSFGNNPAKGYATETYTQKGEPRVVGLTLAYDY